MKDWVILVLHDGKVRKLSATKVPNNAIVEATGVREGCYWVAVNRKWHPYNYDPANRNHRQRLRDNLYLPKVEDFEPLWTNTTAIRTEFETIKKLADDFLNGNLSGAETFVKIEASLQSITHLVLSDQIIKEK